jgi:hypothetical protein
MVGYLRTELGVLYKGKVVERLKSLSNESEC